MRNGQPHVRLEPAAQADIDHDTVYQLPSKRLRAVAIERRRKSAPTTNWARRIDQKGIGDDLREMIHALGKGGLIAYPSKRAHQSEEVGSVYVGSCQPLGLGTLEKSRAR